MFLISINFKLVWLSSLKKIFKRKKIISSIETTKIGKEVLFETENVQETFSFNKKDEKQDNHKRTFELPKLDLLKQPKEKSKKNNLRNDITEDFLERILLDFGVEGKIKKNKFWASCNFK